MANPRTRPHSVALFVDGLKSEAAHWKPDRTSGDASPDQSAMYRAADGLRNSPRGTHSVADRGVLGTHKLQN